MPDEITFGQNLGNSSFDIDPAVLQQRAAEAAQEAEADVVEITITEIPSDSETPPEQTQATYTPATFNDNFQFAIENGILDPSYQFNPLSIRFQSGAVETYEARGSLGSQVVQGFGQDSPYAALFAIQYQNAQPNSSEASSNVDAKTEQQRIADQNLQLLNSL